MRKIIVPIGYMTSGSSAVTDLVSEFANVNNDYGIFEYVFLHCPNGLFDLEDKLFWGNNILRSDEALHSFLACMKDLYDKKHWWVGNYQKIIGPHFYERTEKFIADLTDYKIDYFWYYQEKTNLKMFFKLIIRKLVYGLTFKKVLLPKPRLYDEITLSYPSKEKFYALAKAYIYDVLNMIDTKGDDLLLDQLLLPYNLYRIDNYFDDDLKVILVERDPRDVFLQNKYIDCARLDGVAYSHKVEEFCEQFRKIHEMEIPNNSKKVLKIKFEDLIYKYDETRKKIIKFLGYEKRPVKAGKKRFDPNVSIHNTKLFLRPEYEEEGKYIAKHLKEYLYDFPQAKSK